MSEQTQTRNITAGQAQAAGHGESHTERLGHTVRVPKNKKIKFYNNKKLLLNYVAILISFFNGCVDGNNIIIDPNDAIYPNLDESPVLFPDGQKILYKHYGVDSIDINGGTYINNDSAGLWIIRIDNYNKRIFLRGSNLYDPDISPDGQSIIFNNGNQIYKIDTTGNNYTQLTFQGECYYPRWSSDGNKIIYRRYNGGNPDTVFTYIMNPDGTNNKRIFPADLPSLNTNGTLFAGLRYISTQSSMVSIIDTSGSLKSDEYSYSGSISIRYIHWSFSNNLIALEIQRLNSQVPNIWTLNPDTQNLVNIISEGSITPRWSTDGSQIVYVKHDSRVYDRNNGTVWIADANGVNGRQITPGF